MGMDSEARNQTADLERRLMTEPQRFTMYQALWLIGALNADTAEGIDLFLRRNLRVVPWLSLAFPPSEVVSVERREGRSGGVFRVTVPYYGLYSTMGSLPTFYTEELLDEARDDESVTRDFLDILNNHLYHLLYAANRHGDIPRRTVESASRSAEFIQYSLMGQAEDTLRDPGLQALAIVDLLAQRPRSAVRLERYIAFVLGRGDVEVEQCVERRAPVPDGQRCLLGRGGCTLGDDAVLGSSVADCSGRFRVHLWKAGPRDAGEFLPGRAGYETFRDRVDRYLDSPHEFDLVLHPDGGTPPPAALGAGARLGFYLGSEAVQPVKISWKK
ncbi:type VI secretion system baseplate subunit TssG [Cloacibacillus sp. An23]|uniref:type VI secretion system baseplate subunit TssG n=1 Tax=Cloacibacillus sp. An23 TaxID=1965591 RepID=UPI000B396D98|nr:type VI secretion system baseplate subunit TssG [Cloacibacillus sp. An23]OUO93848.1 hypothetical protein B5F39_06615 [Cloacibacillus sp. An23]